MPKTTVLTGPPGPIVEEAFFADVVEWCTDVRRAPHLLYIVPTARRRIEVENAILGAGPAGSAICQAPVMTLDRFALRLFADAESSEVISWERAALVVDALLNAAPDDFSVLLAGRTTPFPGLVLEILRTIRELKRFSVASDRLTHDSDAKVRELGRLLQRYSEFLAERRWCDERDALRVVGERLADPRFRSAAFADFQWVVFDGFVEFSPSERPLVRALAEHAETTFVMDKDPALAELFPPPPDFAGEARARRASSPFQHAARLAVRHDVPACSSAGPPVVLIEADTREAEVEHVASRIKVLLQGGIPQRDIAVAATDLEQYAPLVEEIFPAHGIPYSIARRPLLLESPVAAALLLLLETPANGFERGDLVRLFRSPFVRFEENGRALEPAVLEALARTTRVFRGRDAWLTSLRERIAFLEQQIPHGTRESDDEEEAAARLSPQRDLRTLQEIEGVLRCALDMLDELQEPRLPCAYADASRRLMARFGIERRASALLAGQAASAVHAQACHDMGAVLNDLERVGRADARARPVSLDDFIALLRSAFAASRLNVRQAREGIEVSDVPNVGGRRSRVLFLMGLVEGAVPRRADPDALLGFATRMRLGLLGRERFQAQDRIELYRALASPSEQLFLCRPLYQDETRLLPPLMWERIESALHPARDEVPPTPTSWRRALCEVALGHTCVPPLETLLASEPFSRDAALHAFAHTRDVEAKRRAAIGAPTPYAGALSIPFLDEVQRVYHREHQFSAHELETYVACPFRFFARWLLDLAPVQEPEEEIGPREKGNVLHAIFRRFYVEWWRRRSAGRIAPEDRGEALELLTGVAQEELAGQPYGGFIWRKLLDRLLGAGGAAAEEMPTLFSAFLDEEIGSTRMPTACTPRYFEFGFGRHEARASLDERSSADPVSIMVGGRRILLRGIIDRIDTNDDRHTFCVLDYKSGSTIPSLRDIVEGRSLQLPIYIMAANDVLGVDSRFAAAGYFQTRDASDCGKKQFFADAALAHEALGRKQWPHGSTFSGEEIEALLARERDTIGRAVLGIEAGYFAVTTLGDEKAGCRGCDYKHICRYDGITLRTFDRR